MHMLAIAIGAGVLCLWQASAFMLHQTCTSSKVKGKLRSSLHQKLISNDKLRCRKSALSMAIKGPVRYTTSDWIDCLVTWPTSRIMNRIKYSLLIMTLWTTFLTWLYKAKSIKFLFPAAIHSIAGSTLSLLLVFRTNSSYDRFWEGRKCWSSIVVACRDLTRLCLSHITPKYHPDIAKLMLSFSVTLKQHLQGERSNSELAPFYSSLDEVGKVQSFKNRPMQVLNALSAKIRSALLDNHHPSTASTDSQQVPQHSVVHTLHEHQFEHYLHGLSAAMAACERIVKQPVPLSYSRHTSRFLTLYLLSLPLTLIPLLGWLSVPTMTAICWSFLSVQEIGHFIEDPFDKETQIIPLSLIISVLRADINEMFGGKVLAGDAYDAWDAQILKKARSRARLKDDNWFEYY